MTEESQEQLMLQFKIGPDAIISYKRLAYTAWHALAEFVDNSTQAYFDNQAVLDAAFAASGGMLEVSIVYAKDEGFLRISDNSIGMSRDDLQRALHVAAPPKNTNGRSKYGMGLKTAACWFGNRWTVSSKKLGETVEYQATVMVDQIASGDAGVECKPIPDRLAELHYTTIEIRDLNREFHSRTLGRIREFLSSMYREDFRKSRLRLRWNGEVLRWEDLDARLLKAHDGTLYKKLFEFAVDNKKVHGWVGILGSGSRAAAGFSIIHCGRVVRGWPDSWRPQKLYGQLQGSNDLINQRLVGEIHLDAFEVSHTKDDILWLGDQEELVEQELRRWCGDYRERAGNRRKGDDDESGPSQKETDAAVDEIKRELSTPELVDVIEIEQIPPPDVINAQAKVIALSIVGLVPTFSARIGSLLVRGYLRPELSPNDPYVTHDSARHNEVLIIVNQAHPHWKQLKGADGVANYLRHCVYDGIAEWQAIHKSAGLHPNTIKLLKDRLLRLALEMEVEVDSDESVPEETGALPLQERLTLG